MSNEGSAKNGSMAPATRATFAIATCHLTDDDRASARQLGFELYDQMPSDCSSSSEHLRASKGDTSPNQRGMANVGRLFMLCPLV